MYRPIPRGILTFKNVTQPSNPILALTLQSNRQGSMKLAELRKIEIDFIDRGLIL